MPENNSNFWNDIENMKDLLESETNHAIVAEFYALPDCQ